MEYIIQNGIAVIYPKSLNQMVRELATEVNKRSELPEVALYIFKGEYHLSTAKGMMPTVYDLDDMVP